MKCQHCEKPATFHITECAGKDVMALHFCAECAEKYLKPTDDPTDTSVALAGMLSQQLKIGQTAEELARLDQKTCPVCGVSFYDFRQSGRLGCPHDYVFFKEELEPLLLNIHGATAHVGKQPTHGVLDADRQTQLIRLRREMKEAIDNEEYELASELRDEIKKVEGE